MSRLSFRGGKTLDAIRRKMIRETEEFLSRHLRQTESPHKALGDNLIPAIDRGPLSDR
jgi:hypothetical protein